VNYLEVTLPIRVVSEANVRECWQAKLRRKQKQRAAVKIGLFNFQRSLRAHKGAFNVALTRIGVRTLDGDNLQRAFKAVRDQVAEACGVDDGAKRIRFEYGQRKGKQKQYAVEIGIRFEEVKDA